MLRSFSSKPVFVTMLAPLPTRERFETLKANLFDIQTQVNQACFACQRDPKEVCIVAVSKLMPASDILGLYELGHRHFGENYVQELLEKAPQLPSDIQWHFIGHLQSNKAKALSSVPNLSLLETLDSMKLADKLNQTFNRPLNVLLQINTSQEQSKSGVEEASALYQHIQLHCPNLNVQGVMTIGSGDPKEFDVLVSKQVIPNGILSMGMTNDFKEAIQRGSTMIRIGRALFGEREKKG